MLPLLLRAAAPIIGRAVAGGAAEATGSRLLAGQFAKTMVSGAVNNTADRIEQNQNAS